jgi:hypothetical protein
VCHRRMPSAAATPAENELAAALAESLTRTRLAFEAATLRGEVARELGDRPGAERALDEQRWLLDDLQVDADAILGRATSSREAGPEPPPRAAGPGS